MHCHCEFPNHSKESSSNCKRGSFKKGKIEKSILRDQVSFLNFSFVYEAIHFYSPDFFPFQINFFAELLDSVLLDLNGLGSWGRQELNVGKKER
jgi:hypothetical protein